jgi:hypothetical protein
MINFVKDIIYLDIFLKDKLKLAEESYELEKSE